MIEYYFDLKFQFLTKNKKKGIWQIQSCDDLILQDKESSIIFTNPQKSQDFRIFRIYLNKKLNQKGFHQQFKPIKQIGIGNYSTIYLVQNNQTKYQYASKTLVKQELYAQYGKQSIISQISILRQLQHRNIIKTHSVYQTNNSIYINTQYCKGGQLYQKIKFSGIQSKNILKQIMKSLITGVEYLHSKNIVHRDLKLQNILFKSEDSYESIIIDFGFAAKITNKNKLFPKSGTPGFMAPQIINLKHHESSIATSSDIFSCGVIFYALIFGKMIFQGNTVQEIQLKNKKCQINYLSQQFQKLPKIWVRLLQGMLEISPQKRLTAKQILNHQFFKEQQSKKIITMIKLEQQFTLNEISQNGNEQIGEDSPLILSQNTKRKKMMALKENKLVKLKQQIQNSINKESNQQQLKKQQKKQAKDINS